MDSPPVGLAQLMAIERELVWISVGLINATKDEAEVKKVLQFLERQEEWAQKNHRKTVNFETEMLLMALDDVGNFEKWEPDLYEEEKRCAAAEKLARQASLDVREIEEQLASKSRIKKVYEQLMAYTMEKRDQMCASLRRDAMH